MNEQKKILRAKKLLNEALEAINILIKKAKTEREKQYYKDIKNRISGSLEREKKDEEKYPDKTLFADAKKILRKFAHFTEKEKKVEDVSDEFKGLMDEADFETKMKNLDKKKYEDIVEGLKKDSYRYEGDEEDIPYLIRTFVDEDGYARERALTILRYIVTMILFRRTPITYNRPIVNYAIKPLIKLLETTDDENTIYIIVDLFRILAEVKYQKLIQNNHLLLNAVGPLIKLLKNKNKDVRMYAAEALGGIGDSRAVSDLIYVVENENEDEFVRKDAVKALGKIGDPRAFPAMIKTLGNKYINMYAKEALLKKEPAIPYLAKALGDENKDVRETSKDLLVGIGEPAVPALINSFKYEDVYEHKYAIQALVILRVDIPYLIKAFGDKDKNVRKYAAKTLTEVRNSSIAYLTKALKDEDKNVRSYAVYTIIMIEKLLEKPIPDNHLILDAIEPLIQLLVTEDKDMHKYAIRMLEKIAKKNKQFFSKEVYSYLTKNNIKTTEQEVRNLTDENINAVLSILKINHNLQRLEIKNPEEIISYLINAKNTSLINSIDKNTDGGKFSDSTIDRINMLSSVKDKIKALNLLDKNILKINGIEEGIEEKTLRYEKNAEEILYKDSLLVSKGIEAINNADTLNLSIEKSLSEKDKKQLNISEKEKEQLFAFFKKHPELPNGLIKQVLYLMRRGVPEEKIINELRDTNEITFLNKYNIIHSNKNINFLFKNKKKFSKLSDKEIIEKLEKNNNDLSVKLQNIRRDNILNELNTGRKLFAEIFKDDEKFKLADSKFDDPDVLKTAVLYFSDKMSELHKKHLKDILYIYNEGLKKDEETARKMIIKHLSLLKENINEDKKMLSYGYNMVALKKTQLLVNASDLIKADIKQQEIKTKIKEIKLLLQDKGIEFDKSKCISDPKEIIDELKTKTEDEELINHIEGILGQIKKVNEMEVKEGKKKAGSIYAHISNDFFKTINAGTYFDVCISLDDGGYNSSALVFAIEENKQVAYITHKENIISMRVLYLTKEGILSTTSYNRGLSHDVANIWVDFFLKLSANCKKDIFFGSRESSSFIENIESKIKNISENQTKDHFIDKVIFDEYYDDYGQSGLYIKDSSLIKSYTHACVLEYAKRDEKRNELYNEVLNKEKKDTHDILKNKPIEDIQKHSFIGNILSGLRHKDKTVRDNALKSVLEGDDEEQKRKTINSLVSNALYSENETRQQNAKEQLKQVNDKELIISVLEEHKVRLEKKRLTEEHKENFNELAEELGIEGYGKDSKDTFIFNNIRIEKEFSATDLEKCASLVRDLGIEENDKILEIGPNEFVSFGLLCAINGANVDFVQPGRNINKTKESINYFFEFNKSEAVLESKKRINIINNYLEDAKELQINYDKYTVITLFNILDIIRNVELIVSEVTKYIKKDGYILISEYSGMQQDFSSKLYLLRSKIEEKGFVLDYIGEKTDGRNDLMVYKVSDKVEKKRATYIIKRKNKIKEDRATLIFQIRDEKGYFLSKKAIKFEFNGEKEYQKTSENGLVIFDVHKGFWSEDKSEYDVQAEFKGDKYYGSCLYKGTLDFDKKTLVRDVRAVPGEKERQNPLYQTADQIPGALTNEAEAERAVKTVLSPECHTTTSARGKAKEILKKFAKEYRKGMGRYLYKDILKDEKERTQDVLRNQTITDVKKRSFIGHILSSLNHEDKDIRDNSLKSIFNHGTEDQKKKAANYLISTALYSKYKTKRQNAIEQLKQINDKELITEIYSEQEDICFEKSLWEKYKKRFAKFREKFGIENIIHESGDTGKTFIFNKNIELPKQDGFIHFGDIDLLIKHLGVNENYKILEIRPGNRPHFGLLCALKEAHVDFVQPRDSSQINNPCTESIDKFIEKHKLEETGINSRIRIIDIVLEKAEILHGNHYNIITLFNVFDDPSTDVDNRVPEIVKYIKEGSFLLISEYTPTSNNARKYMSLLTSAAEEKGFVLVEEKDMPYGDLSLGGRSLATIYRVNRIDESSENQTITKQDVLNELNDIEEKTSALLGELNEIRNPE